VVELGSPGRLAPGHCHAGGKRNAGVNLQVGLFVCVWFKEYLTSSEVLKI
jgi:hypothetical protein